MSSYPLLDAFLTMLWFFLWILWLILLFRIIADIFASHDLGGGAKAAWLILVIILPFLGVFLYLIVRGKKMTERDVQSARAKDHEFREYIRQAAGEGSSADQLAKLADLHDRGAITDQEFEQAKAGILTGKAA